MAAIGEKIKKIVQRTDVIIEILDTVMLIPYVGEVAAAVLEPAVGVLNSIKSGIAKVKPEVIAFGNKVHQWTEPLKTVQHKVEWVEKSINSFTVIVNEVEGKASAAEGCVNSLPAGRTPAIHALEGASGKLDVIPHGFRVAFGAVDSGCQKVEGALARIHLVRKRRGLLSLSKVNHVLDAILKAFGPFGHFLDEVNGVLNKKFCLLESIEKLVEEGAKVGKEIAKEAEHIGKVVVHGAKHIVGEAGHIWVEVDKGAEHAIHVVGHGIGSAYHKVVDVVKHVGEEIGHGVVTAAKTVGHEAKVVGETVEKGVVTAAKTVEKGVVTAAHKVGHFFKHLFGRGMAENVYFIDGELYVLVDGHVETRTRRGLDICFSLGDILKGLNVVTGGLMKAAKGLISKLFHGKSPFHLPGLTGDVLHIGSLFHSVNLASILPSAKDLLKLPQADMQKIMKLNVKMFDQVLPHCRAAFAKFNTKG